MWGVRVAYEAVDPRNTVKLKKKQELGSQSSFVRIGWLEQIQVLAFSFLDLQYSCQLICTAKLLHWGHREAISVSVLREKESAGLPFVLSET